MQSTLPSSCKETSKHKTHPYVICVSCMFLGLSDLLRHSSQQKRMRESICWTCDRRK